MNHFTFLTEQQIYGEQNLKMFSDLKAKAELTDYSILLGAFFDQSYWLDLARPSFCRKLLAF